MPALFNVALTDRLPLLFNVRFPPLFIVSDVNIFELVAKVTL